MMGLKLITPPVAEPITLAEAKKHLNVTHTDDDDYIQSLIAVACANIDAKDGHLGRALVTQTWELTLDRFPCREIEIPVPPLQSVASIKYDDADGVEQTIDAAHYQVDSVSEPGWIIPVAAYRWPVTLCAANAVRVQFVCGYAPGTDSPVDLALNVPMPIKQAMKITIADLYENRGSTVIGKTVQELPWAAKWLLQPYRIWSH